MGTGGERAGSAGCEAAGPGVGPFRARVELLAGRALPAPVRVAAPPATNENVRKSMRGNKRADTRPELVVRARLRAAGLSGYRLQWKVPGHPDVAWPGKKVALFGSYGWGDGQWMRDWCERVKEDGAQLFSDEGLICNETPDDDAQAACRKLGADLANW